MPLVSFDAHEAVVAAFQVPYADRYQIIREHEASHLVARDTGLGISRTSHLALIQVVTRPRSREAKQTFYRLLTEKLEAACGIAPSGVIVSLVVNSDEDWSFGLGRARFLTGEL
ncbi:tautomerase family protein [Nguyenibacter sp. L1]|uniref:tautomerase family protein n=1 Tax=Nguyenibacter sp. L1 TaxID=3049350 RepID=UPI002B4A09BE|nr:tautomerase family protein [Nguyenibacter sp. L1]WRH88796.1 tautomerase family protein [Nguyenibacter sp. L1]